MPKKNKTGASPAALRHVDPYQFTRDGAYAADPELKVALRQKLLQMPPAMLKARLERQVRENRAINREARDLSIIARVLDTGGTSTGNVLPRVDLEQTITSLFITQFPWFARLAKGPANGLRHTWNTATATGSGTDTQLTAASDLANAYNDTGVYQQFQTVNLAIFDTLRGVSLKELYAVQQSGMSYSPETEEMLLGVTRLKSLVQRAIFQANQSVAAPTLGTLPSSWLTTGAPNATSEYGLYTPNSFDGLRLITAGGINNGTSNTTTYNANAVVVNQDGTTGGGPFTISQAVNYNAAQVMNNGGTPSILVGSPIVLNKLMNEQEGKQRADAQTLVPGITVPGINTTAGNLPFIYAPGSTAGGGAALGSYTRASDGVTVEDLYVLDESMLVLRYLGTEDLQVIEIPVGVDTQLSRRFIIFGIYGLQVRDAGLFQGKVRIPV